jgi:uncharacterized membrane protein
MSDVLLLDEPFGLDALAAVTFSAALGSGLMAGVFLAFSSFVMSALARLPAPQGMTVFLGTSALCVVLLVMTLVSAPRHGVQS